MSASIEIGNSLAAALRFSVIVARWDNDSHEYLSSDSVRDMELQSSFFATKEDATNALREHSVEAAWIVDGVDGSDELVFP